MDRRTLLAWAGAALAAGCASDTGPPPDPGALRRAIDGSVDRALGQLYAQRGMRELVGRAQGVLVFPEVFTAGLLVGGSHGQGAMRKQNQTTGYFSLGAASVGLTAGAQTRAMFLLFMAIDALAKFEASNGWTIGADATVAVADVGIDTRAVTAPIVCIVRSQSGFMANVSLEGTKINRLPL